MTILTPVALDTFLAPTTADALICLVLCLGLAAIGVLMIVDARKRAYDKEVIVLWGAWSAISLFIGVTAAYLHLCA